MTMVVQYVVPASPLSITNAINMNATTILVQLLADFTFTGGSIGSQGFSITQNGNNYQLTFASNNQQTLTMDYDSNIDPSTLNSLPFTMPAWVNYIGGGINPVNHNTNTNSGTILFTISSNSGYNSSTRSGDLVYIGGETLPSTGVNHIDITQPGTVSNQSPM